MQIFAIVVSLAIAAVGIALFVRAIRAMLGVIRVGQPAMNRTDDPGSRTVTLVKETLGHTRMLQWTWVGIGHWFIFVGFGLLFFTLLTAFGQLFDAGFALPLIGHFFLYEWVSELFTWVMIVAISAFIIYRLTRPRERVRGPKGRFYRSTMWQGYFVEAVILSVGLCIVVLRGLEYALFNATGEEYGTAFHFPLTFWIGEAFSGLSVGTLENLIYFFAMLKILVSFTWMIVISRNLTMGVAWHRFTAFFNIWFKRESSGRTALGAVKPLTSGGERLSLDDIEDLDEDAKLGVGAAEDFSWKNILDFTTCTECGRCQSQCPAWNTEKPLNPKLLITALRDHTYAKAPYLQAAEGDREKVLAEGGDTLVREVERPLVGDTAEDEWFYMPDSGSAVIDAEVLWNCTTCGACVQQCPVDIEHVDHIIDMRRHQMLVENNFPAELNQLFKGLENKGNPWNMSPSSRMDWAKDLPFDVKVVGGEAPGDPESLDEVDWLFWVGCAGAYEDRAKKTTRAVAELLDTAGVSFAVLGNGETCNGDPARRAGNEFVFQGLATQNAETFKEYQVKKVVSACAHCFNTLKNEYKEFGVELEVVHHTQLLNRLVREGRLTPVADGAGAHKRSITYHDPCYIGRHNGVYTPPRELLQILPGAEVKEMPRNSERSFCCGAGGARMWMEETTGERINMNRTNEAVATGADQIAVGCPFCRVMLSDGLSMAQSQGEAREEVEVLDVAQMLLASVKGEQATKLAPGSTTNGSGPAAAPAAKAAGGAAAGAGAGAAAGAGGGSEEGDVALKAEPEEGDVTQTEDTVTATEDAGPLAKASGGSSLFDTPTDEPDTTDEAKPVAEEARAAKPASAGGSLFDLGGDDDGDAASEDSSEVKATGPAAEPAAETSEAAAPAEATAASAATEPSDDLGGGSLFDLDAPAADAPAAAAPAADEAADRPADGQSAEQAEESAPATASTAEEDTPTPAAPSAPAEPTSGTAGLGSTGSLFDIAAPEPTTGSQGDAPADRADDVEEPVDTTDESTQETEHTDQAADQPAEPAAEATPSAQATETAEPAQEIPEGGSLFDLVAPEPTPAAAAAPAAAEPDEAASSEVTEPSEVTETPGATESAQAPGSSGASEASATADDTAADDTAADDNVPTGADVSAAATRLGSDAAAEPAQPEATEAGPSKRPEATDAEPAERPDATEPAPADQPDAEPTEERPTDAGPAHTPRTDAEIGDSGSLFDL